MKLEQIKSRLMDSFQDGTVDVVDLTGTEDHYEVYVASKLFQGLNRIEQHQKVMSVFSPELKTGEVHALSIRTKVLN